MKTLHLNDNWIAFSTAMEEQFTDHQEPGKNHEKLLALKYASNMQTYLVRFNKLNSHVQRAVQALKCIITVAITPDMYRNSWSVTPLGLTPMRKQAKLWLRLC